MTEIEIPDRAPDDDGRESDDQEAQSPYRNLLVPLVVVPALIVMVLVLVFVLFGLVAGDPPTPTQNLDRLLTGGANEREQAAFGLVRQFLARDADGEAEWTSDPELLPKLRAAWADHDDFDEPDEVPIPLALAVLMAELGDPEAVRHLGELTALSDELDPDGIFRFYAGSVLGMMGGELAEPERESAARALVRLARDSVDPGLRLVAAAGLQKLPSAETVPTLRTLLDDPSLELRGTAALSLAELGDAGGVGVLVELLSVETYTAERRQDASKWTRQEQVGLSRLKALEALAGLGRAPRPDELGRIAEEDPDPALREAARRLLGAQAGD